MNIISWKSKPFKSINRLPNIYDTIFNEKFYQNYDDTGLSPAVDIIEDENSYKITADMPGLNKSNIEVKIENDNLILYGDKKLTRDDEEKGYHYQERQYGKFSRSFKLPEAIKIKDVSASFENGVLSIVIPKSEEAKPNNRLIKIK